MQPSASPTAPPEVPTGLLLRIWEAVSSERSVVRVLEAAADTLVEVVPFDGVGLFSLDDWRRNWTYVVGYHYREGETPAEYMSRPEFGELTAAPEKPVRSYEELAARHVHVCNDLWQCDAWFPHEHGFATHGIRAYVWVPLVTGGTLLGAAIFMRGGPVPFTPPQVAILTAASRAFAVAVANALANDEIDRLRRELEAENLELKAQLGHLPWFEGIVGTSEAMRKVLARVEQVATTDATVLITGETGTGKELIARALHRRSPRAGGPFVKVNVAAIPDTLLASELFGHERGAFTGATERRRGRFEQADGGTIFLDEIGELPPAMQVILLRVLQERELERLGGTRPVRVDVRVVAATNRDLVADVQAGRFRSDLFYRLNAFPVHLPALRERMEDLPLLVSHLAAKYAARLGRTIDRIDARSLRLLARHHWPGNVRELENVVERAVILSRGGRLRIDREVLPITEAPGIHLDERLDASERSAIEDALRASRGRVSGPSGAARKLGLPASTLEFRIRRLGIDKFQFRR
ncbi:MAG TPA: sigma-54-dependent Fis family transcriptional regulator [Vicinamibacterales bacterium]